MRTFPVVTTALSVLAAICIGSAAAAAEDPFSAARDLYASAAYEQALAMLTGLHDVTIGSSVREQIEQYRAFCLFALGRTAAAESIAESLTRDNPMMQLETGDASPRLIAMFAGVRKRLLPELIREHYRSARVAMDAEDLSAAEPQLLMVRQMLDEAERVAVIDEALADVRLLVDGFLHLVRTSKTNAQLTQRSTVEGTVMPAAQPADAPIAAKVAGDVIAPVAILQDVPSVPADLMVLFRDGPTTGILDLVIDDQGNVEGSAMRQSINPFYDALVVRASKRWKYRPAQNGAIAVRYLKTIKIVVQK